MPSRQFTTDRLQLTVVSPTANVTYIMSQQPSNPSGQPCGTYYIAYDIQRVYPGGLRVSICLHGPRMAGGFGKLEDARRVRDALLAAYITAGTLAVLEIVPHAVSEDWSADIIIDQSADESLVDEPDYLKLPALKFS